jgi:D-sedoheptulose 7-phosphate isomerase
MKQGGLTETLRNLVQDRVRSSIQAKQALLADSDFQDTVMAVAMKIVDSLRAGGKLFLFGNGGSATDAEHLAAEFTGRYLKERRGLAAIALNVNLSAMTAIGNDYGFEAIFARQMEALGKAGDVAIGITTSGNSRNVIRALEVAKSMQLFTVALTGESGGKARDIAECTIRIPSQETPRIQECHILTGHIICELVENTMFENK